MIWFGYLDWLVHVQVCWFEFVNKDGVSFAAKINLEELWFLFGYKKCFSIQALEGGVPSATPDENVISML